MKKLFAIIVTGVVLALTASCTPEKGFVIGFRCGFFRLRCRKTETEHGIKALRKGELRSVTDIGLQNVI